MVYSGFWIPSDESDWTTVHMTNVTSTYFTSNFKMKFRFEGNGGNNFYLDDINLYAGPASNDLVLGVQETAIISSLELFPNPVEDELQLQFISKQNEAIQFSIVDVTGKILSRQIIKAVAGSNIVLFPVSNLASGAYFLKMGSEESTNALRFIVK